MLCVEILAQTVPFQRRNIVWGGGEEGIVLLCWTVFGNAHICIYYITVQKPFVTDCRQLAGYCIINIKFLLHVQPWLKWLNLPRNWTSVYQCKLVGTIPYTMVHVFAGLRRWHGSFFSPEKSDEQRYYSRERHTIHCNEWHPTCFN